MAASTDSSFVFLVQKMCKDHPNHLVLREPFRIEWEKRANTISPRIRHLVLYSLGKIGLITPELIKLSEECLKSDEPHTFLNAAIYNLSGSLATDEQKEEIKDKCILILDTDNNERVTKSISKVISLLQSITFPIDDLLEKYRSHLIRNNYTKNSYLTRVLPSEEQEITVMPVPIESVKSVSPYLQSKLAYYLTKGGFNTQLESLVGNYRVDLLVEDLCVEIDGVHTKASIYNKLTELRNQNLQTECASKNLRYLVIDTAVEHEWKADSILCVLDHLKKKSSV